MTSYSINSTFGYFEQLKSISIQVDVLNSTLSYLNSLSSPNINTNVLTFENQGVGHEPNYPTYQIATVINAYPISLQCLDLVNGESQNIFFSMDRIETICHISVASSFFSKNGVLCQNFPQEFATESNTYDIKSGLFDDGITNGQALILLNINGNSIQISGWDRQANFFNGFTTSYSCPGSQLIE